MMRGGKFCRSVLITEVLVDLCSSLMLEGQVTPPPQVLPLSMLLGRIEWMTSKVDDLGDFVREALFGPRSLSDESSFGWLQVDCSRLAEELHGVVTPEEISGSLNFLEKSGVISTRSVTTRKGTGLLCRLELPEFAFRLRESGWCLDPKIWGPPAEEAGFSLPELGRSLIAASLRCSPIPKSPSNPH